MIEWIENALTHNKNKYLKGLLNIDRQDKVHELDRFCVI